MLLSLFYIAVILFKYKSIKNTIVTIFNNIIFTYLLILGRSTT